MERFDRLFGIVLLLRDGRPVSAGVLAERFGVSRRTIYRDLETLGLSGVPVYAERGRGGGIRLLEGYFLPPLTFSQGEAIALTLGLTLLHSLRTVPYATEAEAATRKLLAAVPARLRATLEHAERVVGVEPPSADIFHPEPDDGAATAGAAPEGETVTCFLQALLDGRTVCLRYRSPYREGTEEVEAAPLGLLWDRDRWYLVGRPDGSADMQRLWRADRVVALVPGPSMEDLLVRIRSGMTESAGIPPTGGSAGKQRKRAPALPGLLRANEGFDVRALLGRGWLQAAMDAWRDRAPVRIRLTETQATRLGRDWYYRHARFEREPTGAILMTIGEDDPAVILALLRWLGPEAELVAPEEWRGLLREELRRMLVQHATDPEG